MVTSRSMRWLVVLFASVSLAPALPGADEQSGAGLPRGRVEGRALDSITGAPLAGARITVLAFGLPPDQRKFEAVSDGDGRYSLEIPLGHAQFWGVEPPPGYYIHEASTRDRFATTSNQPLQSRDFKFHSGMSWRVELKGVTIENGEVPIFLAYRATRAPQGAMLLAGPQERMSSRGNEAGTGILTVPLAGGDFEFLARTWRPLVGQEIPNAKGTVDAEFDPKRVIGQEVLHSDGQGFKLTDAAGRTATVEGAEVVVENGQAIMRFTPRPAAAKGPERKPITFRARAVDEKGMPLAGVRFKAAFSRLGSGSVPYDWPGDAEGKLELKDQKLHEGAFMPKTEVYLLVVKPGYHGVETKRLDMAGVMEEGVADFDTVTLRPGQVLRGRVVNEAGEPCVGAVVTNATNYFLYHHLQCRTDAEGRFTMPGLTFSTQRLEAQFGEQSGHTEYAFDANSAECVVTVKARPKMGRREVPPTRQPERPAPKPSVAEKEWDLTPPRKEPVYQHKPVYALLLFGSDCSQRVWVVLDGQTLYVDCNGNGDLTEEGKRFEPIPEPNILLGNPGMYSSLGVYEFTVRMPTGEATEFQLIRWVRAEDYEPIDTFEKRMMAEQKKLGYERALLTRKGGRGGGAALCMMPRPADASVSPFDGPLTMVVRSPDHQVLQRGAGGCQLSFSIVFPGRAARGIDRPHHTRLAISEVPEGAYLEVEIEYPAKSASELPPRRKFTLKERCCGDSFYGTVSIPDEAGPGVAKVAVRLVGWPERPAKPALVEVPIDEED